MSMEKKLHKVRFFLTGHPRRFELLLLMGLSISLSLLMGAASIAENQQVQTRAQVPSQTQPPSALQPTHACVGEMPCTTPPPTPTPCLLGRNGPCGVPTNPVISQPIVQPGIQPSIGSPTHNAVLSQPISGGGNGGLFGKLFDRIKKLLGGLLGGSGGGGVAKNPPSQPETGPGGKNYPNKSVVITKLPKDQNGKDLGAIVEPADPHPSTAPVFIFIHSAGAANLNYYQEMMEHIAKNGNIVIYPYIGPNSIELFLNLFIQGGWGGGDVMKNGCFQPADEVLAVNAIQTALNILQTRPGHVQPDLDKVAYGGHSLGGDGSLTLAGNYAKDGLPAPKALMVSSPCPVGDDTPFANLPSSIKLLVINGDSSKTGGVFGSQIAKYASESGTYQFALKVWANTAHIPNRDFIIVHSDNHGTPGLNADHFAIYGAMNPTTRLGVDAKVDGLDWNAYWKLSTALLSCASNNVDCKYAFGNTPEQTDMGNWSDGTPVRKLEITHNPPATIPP
jgi:hypothetical protein